SALTRRVAAGEVVAVSTAERFAHALHERLSAHAEDFRLHPPQNSALSRASGLNVLNAAYLVTRAHSEEFVELVDRTKDEEAGFRVELTGPWAAYSFTGEAGETGETVETGESAGAAGAGEGVS
ncbi:GvpL/GvpF family gas vesicle protein, partial [Streptomyces sp. WELS2]|uniref:GvpL/GvpF family gas vesicle protein n=1 Tax=Streptomyces sp. WELS2 TaxID=2749435 RepID=UPI0015F00A19